ncbi:MAG: Hsp33 family molecular chaperone HslO [Planctomycetes bacterium]|nr:Hsp33 family molecular chaperone HslO [Planctomycetota bacterium]
MTTNHDRVLRAMSDDGAFRVMTLRATDTIRGIVGAQSAVGEVAGQLGELIAGAVLVRETMAPGHRVQALVIDPDHGQLVADAWPEGGTRGLVQLADRGRGIALGGATHLQVVRIVHGGRQHQGVVETTAAGGISDALMLYFQQSEQTVTMTQVACVRDGEHVVAAGGFVIQLLPELTEPPLAAMTRRLEQFGALGPRLAAHDADPDRLLHDLLEGMPFTFLADDPVRFACPCDESRVLAAMITLGRDELRELIAKGETLGVDCDYCARHYAIGPDRLRTVLARMDSNGG